MTKSLLLYFIDRLAKQKKLQGIQEVHTAKDKRKEKQKTLPTPQLEAPPTPRNLQVKRALHLCTSYSNSIN